MCRARETRLLASDQQRSVLCIIDASSRRFLSYSPYGYRPLCNGLLSLLGFNGEPPDQWTGHYHLGSGYRAFNPVLMRFNIPDSWSPFGYGGLNSYAYCAGDPVNRDDPTGHIPNLLKPMLRRFGVIKEPVGPLPTIDRVLPPTSVNIKDESYKLVGYHGTSAEHARQMQNTGLKPEFDTKPNPSFGSGFYTTSRVSKAQDYANFRSTLRDKSNPDGLLAVYVKNPSKIPNNHYRFIPEADELVLRPQMYSSVIVLPFHRSTFIQTPKLDINKIFKKKASKTRTAS